MRNQNSAFFGTKRSSWGLLIIWRLILHFGHYITDKARSVMNQHGRQQENRKRNSDIEMPSAPRNDGVDDSEKKKTVFLDPKGNFMLIWNAMFLLSCVIAVWVDSLFFYLPVINQDDKCLALDRRLLVPAICFRSVFDMIYFVKIILEFLCPYRDEDASRTSGQIELVTDPRKIRKRYLRSSYFVIDILAILPIPQVVLVSIIFSKMRRAEFLRKIYGSVLLQYVPRVLRIYLSWRKLIESSRKLARRIWVKAAFNIFLYILASHVLGAFWYFFSIERETACWHMACENHIGCTPSAFNCGRNLGNYAFLDDACPVKTPNTTLVDFGIFLEALQSGTVASTNILQKILHCFWWGLRNLSSLGQNLQTSTYIWENCFAIFISIFGLILFLYFIGNAQTYIQMTTEKAQKATEKVEMEATRLEKISSQMKIKKLTMQLWISKHKIPPDIKERVLACIKQRLEENKDFNTEKPIHHLSNADLLKEIKHHLCLPLLRKVQILNNEKLSLLQWICESLKPLYYNENSYILREGEPLDAMLFITQGSVWCFKVTNSESPQCIEKGEFYGEELIEWGFNGSPSPNLSDFPISTKTVKTLTKVEAFALTANDLKIIVARHFQATSQASSTAKDFRRRINEKMDKSSPKMDEKNNSTSCHDLGASIQD